MFDKIKRALLGSALNNEAISGEKYSVLWGLPILSSDAISSVAYAVPEMLIVLIPAIGLASYHYAVGIALCIIGLMMILVLSYRQTIEHYPNGGGSYIVAKDNLGVYAGVTAGSALAVDYIMTVAVSVSAGVEQISSAFVTLKPYSVEICIVIVLLLMVGNLRGIRESSRIFGIPTYLFIFSMLLLIVTGFIKVITGAPIVHAQTPPGYYGVGSISLFLLLRAFSNGCTALTGVEAVSNAIPNCKEPVRKTAKRILLLMGLSILVILGGLAFLTNIYHPTPGEGQPALIVQMADMIFGRATVFNAAIFYFISGSAFLILVLAANTAYSDFPMLLSVMAQDGFMPRQFKTRGERLVFSNGIVFLTTIALLLIVVFKANVTRLIGLYAIGVFLSFTLSQTGMFIRLLRTKEHNWLPKALINGLGALVTATAVIIIAITKFGEGAWIVVIIIPLMVFSLLKVKKHYFAISKQLKLTAEELKDFDLEHKKYRNRVIVPIDSVNRSSVRSIRYARTISDNVVVFSVTIDHEAELKLRETYAKLNTDIPLIVKYSPYRKIVEPLLEYIASEEYKYETGDIITVLLARFEVKKWWHRFLHNTTHFRITRNLLKHKHVVVSTIPLQLNDDDDILHSEKYNPTNEKPW
ncbi:MAG: APC family permease [Eubacteriales bacterium]|nr:APC family permease [Eubacteriales bacterium]